MLCESIMNCVFEYATTFCNIVDIIITCTLVQSMEWETVIKESKEPSCPSLTTFLPVGVLLTFSQFESNGAARLSFLLVAAQSRHFVVSPFQ
ncbi:unnamed protein product [Heterotrigona itama]|uniref:Uncharacterized protein n=1 Tax=Heterotrigona itama TaxID=395501 RepID=A0A6V7GZT5_9HYME|nr:unnamed protein product [Heterotrigona itama]